MKKRGFTLIELLVVISIIALLMGILMPALNRVRKHAKQIACQARLKSWGLAIKLYTDDYEGRFNPGWDRSLQGDLWMVVLRPYYANEPKMLLCPMATVPVAGPADWGTFKAWERNVAGEDYVGSYSINSWTNNMTQDRGERPEEWFWKTTHNVSNAHNVPVFADSTWMDAWPRAEDTPPPEVDDFGWGNQGVTNEMRHFCIDRHNGWINFAFLDWSVRTVGLKELWTLKWHRDFDTNGAWTQGGNPNGLPVWPQWMSRYKDF